MTALTWTTLGQTLLAIMVKAQPPFTVPPVDMFTATLLPRATSYAESRISQEIPLLGNRTEDATQATTAGDRQIAMNTVIVPETFSLVTPISTAPASGSLWSYDLVDKDFIDSFWPMQSVTLAPGSADNIGRYWALLNYNTIIIAPTPDQTGYAAKVTGLQATQALSESQPTTYLTTNYPDLYTAACMVFLSGALLHNYNSQGDSPQQAISWESQYQELKAVAEFEEKRRRGLLPDWPKATPPPMLMQQGAR